MILLAGLLAAAPATGDDAPSLSPAPQAAILAGVRACIGATVDPAGQAARVEGWVPIDPAQRAAIKTDGDVVTRDNVLLIYKADMRGGCVVFGQGDASFDRARFFVELSAAAGVTFDDAHASADLANGEMMVAKISASPPQGARVTTPNPSNNYVVVAIANKAAEAAKHFKGN